MAENSPAGPADDLLHLALRKFGNLGEAEVKLARAAPLGEWADCGPTKNAREEDFDPGKGEEWGAERTIRADLIRWLCVDAEA